MKKIFFYTFVSACLFFSVTIPLVALAQTTLTPCAHTTSNGGCDLGYTPLEPIPGLTDNSNLISKNGLGAVVNAIFKIFITVGALFAVLTLTIGGIQYMVSGSAVTKEGGIKRAKAALWAIVLLSASWLILNTINPKLLNFSLDPCPTGAVGCTINGTAAPAQSTSQNSGNSLGLTTQEQQNIQDNKNNPDQTTCTDARAAVQNPGFLTSLGLTFGVSSVVEKDQTIRDYVTACANKGL